MSHDPDRVERAAGLIGRLLDEPQLRRRFRREPEPLLRDAGLADLTSSVLSGPVALQTLEVRELRSSLAGVFAAAIAEGVGLLDLQELTREHPRSEAAQVVQRAVTRATETRRPPRSGAQARRGVARSGAVARPRGDAEPVAEVADAGGGGAADLLSNPRLELPAGARADLESGKVDPRIPLLLERLLRDHTIRLSVIRTGHSQFVRGGGGVSNHFVGRGLDIAAVDGAPVSAGNPGAHELAAALGQLPKSLRPSEVGSPWPFSPPSIYFQDGDHHDHIHVGWDDPPSDDLPASATATAVEPATDAPAAAPARSGATRRPGRRPARSGAHRVKATPLVRSAEDAEAAVQGAPTKFAAEIDRAAERHRVDPNLLRGLIRQESGFNPRARSPAGAIGLCQLMPATARSLGVDDPTDPQQNVMGGARYLRQQLDAFDGNERLALAAYNAGPGAVSRAGGIPQNGETPEYVRKVLAYAREYRGQAPSAGEPKVRAAAAGPPPGPSRSGAVTRARGPVRSGGQPLAEAAEPASSLGDRMVAIARKEIGVRERSPNAAPRIAQYARAVQGGAEGQPWCANFVSWVAKRAGHPIGDHHEGFAGVSAVWMWGARHGDAELATGDYRPRPGDLIVFKPYGSHIGLVERVLPDGRIRTIEGNHSDRVDAVVRAPGEVFGYVRMRSTVS